MINTTNKKQLIFVCRQSRVRCYWSRRKKNGKSRNKQLLIVTLNKEENHLAGALKRLMKDPKSLSNGNFVRAVFFSDSPFLLSRMYYKFTGREKKSTYLFLLTVINVFSQSFVSFSVGQYVHQNCTFSMQFICT
jgi:hypothetical protein